MSISTATDIVMDVARAADPQRATAAVQKLKNLEAGAAKPVDFAALTAASSKTTTSEASLRSSAIFERNTTQAANKPAQKDPVENAYQSLGALMMQKSIEGMMPKSTQALFGTGNAGGIWNAMLAEHMATKAAAAAFHMPSQMKPHDREASAATIIPSVSVQS